VSFQSPNVNSKAVQCVFAKLVEEKATEEANARANASWTLMCKKMVAIEREACAKVCDELQDIPATEPRHCAEDIRARSGGE